MRFLHTVSAYSWIKRFGVRVTQICNFCMVKRTINGKLMQMYDATMLAPYGAECDFGDPHFK
jgi:hypothetical protein